MHAPAIAQVDYLNVITYVDDAYVAVNVVSSGVYEDDNEDGDILIYSEHNGAYSSSILRDEWSSRSPIVFLEFRNEYRLEVSFNKHLGKFSSVQCLYADFDLEGGELFVFEFNGVDGFNVYLLGRDFCEVDYPEKVHALQKSRPRKACVKLLTDYEPVNDVLAAPVPSIQHCVDTLQLRCFIEYILSNGKKLFGGFDRSTPTFSGFQLVVQLLKFPDLKKFNLLLLTYEDNGNLLVGLFDDNFVEDISAQFRSLWHMWGKTDYINVYSGNALEVADQTS
ncbi:hypothetical protein DCAR_0414698 [Daucus carota subsp. sativus]|uniref:YDG domain-containing protein n=1 Tax=Daucus carota subsp. sativus TaxID=79200 RepID=A0A164ZYU3_DAUCS|nr:hypothetical protein DCAR_0414698 [Daucus carota subsp. sativus]